MTQKTTPIFITLAMLLAICGTTPQAFSQDRPDRELGGKEVYQLFCVLCHGPRGQGSPLGKPVNGGDALGLSDEQIIRVIAKGRADKGMMAFDTGLRPSEIRAVAMYVRELQGRKQSASAGQAQTHAQTATKPAGDVRRGEALFNNEAKCIQCHSYYTRGGVIGPALDAFASRLTAEEIREAVLLPSNAIVEGYGGKEIALKNGKKLRGRFRYETDESLQILGDNGTLWTTYFKSELRSVADLETSLMPHGLLDKLSEEDQTALFAFLASLR